MKAYRTRTFGIAALIAVIVSALALTGCDSGNNPGAGNNETPVPGDSTVSGLEQLANSVTAVAVTPKQGKSTGAVTIYYEGAGGTAYTKKTAVPQAADAYTVTFDIAAVKGFKAAQGLAADTLIVGAADVTIESVGALETWLAGQTANTRDKPYTVVAELDDLSGLRETLNIGGKYVSLYLKGSGITSIPDNAFYDHETKEGCAWLTGISIPDGVTGMGIRLFGIAAALKA